MSVPSALRASLRDRVAARPPQGAPLLRQAAVSAVNSDGTVDLTIAGSSNTVDDVVCADSVFPWAGATVWCAQFGGDLLVIATQGAAPWQAYTPTLTASTTDPTLGTGSSRIGRYRRVGRALQVYGSIQFGTSGAAAGSGTYRVGLPFAVSNDTGSAYTPFGTAVGRDNSGSVSSVGVLQVLADGDTYTVVRYQTAAGTGAFTGFDNATPWTWANNDRIDFHGTFELQ